jgi:hypothetical protein
LSADRGMIPDLLPAARRRPGAHGIRSTPAAKPVIEVGKAARADGVAEIGRNAWN